ncbi:MAG: hypothetical protein U0175_02480 [Caldilineaceae bacterium]
MNWTIGWRQNIIYRSSTLLLALLLTGCGSIGLNPRPTTESNIPIQPSSPISSEGRLMGSQATWAYLSFNELANQATAIFLGKVTAISPAQWNQDSGEYWDDSGSTSAALVLHYIEIEVQEPLIDNIGLEKQVKLPTLSEYYLVDEKLNVIEEKLPRRHDLVAGDQAVFFIDKTELAWRGGVRPVLYLATYPGQSYFKLGGEGLYHGELLEGAFTLDELKAKILAEREKPA